MRALLVVALVGCSDPPRPHYKPSAPVAIALAQRALGGGDFEVTLTARPTRDVESLELTLAGTRRIITHARAGQAQVLITRVHLVGAGREVVGAAATRIAGQRRNIATSATIGTPKLAARPPSRIITLPDGTRVDEVRP